MQEELAQSSWWSSDSWTVHQSVLQNLTADRDAAKLSMVKSHADLLHMVELELTCRGQGGQHGPKNPVLALPGSFWRVYELLGLSQVVSNTSWWCAGWSCVVWADTQKEVALLWEWENQVPCCAPVRRKETLLIIVFFLNVLKSTQFQRFSAQGPVSSSICCLYSGLVQA